MPYDVSGMLEAAWEPPPTHGQNSLWFPALCLDGFGLLGDAHSDYLFGLAKVPMHRARFAGRGVPRDCSRILRLLVQDNESFIVDHGEGDFGHTHAGLHEIDAALASPDAPLLSESPWQRVLEVTRQLHFAFPSIPREHWRFVVWANW